METTRILSASFLDILFDGRNKTYGAYELRNTYSKRMWQALGITLLLFLLIGGSAYLRNSYAKKSAGTLTISPEVIITEILSDEAKDELPPPPPPKPQVDVPKVQTVKLTTPVVVDNHEVAEPPPSQEEIRGSKISIITQAGVKDRGVAAPLAMVDGDRGLIVTQKTENDPNRIFEKVEIDAKYPGGAGAWRRFLEMNLRGDTPIDHGASPGTYTVIIQFVVDKAGKVSEIKPLTNVGFGMEEEAMRVIKKSGKWVPAIQNGSEVTAYRKQPITFQVIEQ
mgnify:CR=1 FL=1